ncbi:Protein of unknown function [Gryllus bimaculatus]|nr:Protein of unknown function [Gryllus bimaculatus]
MMAAAPWPQPPPAPPSARLERLEGGATAEGVDFERKVAGLAALRSRRLGARFQVFSNVAAAHPFDDVVVRLTVSASSPPSATAAAAAASAAGQQALEDAWATYFLQLKHTGTKALSLKTFTTNRNFHLKKYFEFFLKLRGWHEKKQNPQEALEDGQRLLCQALMEHCRFVIFTTQKRWVGASTCAADDEDVHKMAREILDTGETHDCVLRFTQNDKKVWNLLKGDANEAIYQNEFLPKLLIYCEQTESGHLDSSIKREIKTLLGDPLLQLDLLTFHFLDFLKEWMRDDAKDFCLTEDSAEVEWYLAEHLRGLARKACALELLQFQDSHWGPLREALQREGALALQVAGVAAGARAAKLLGLLDAEHQGAWVYVNGHVLSQCDAKALKAVCCARHCRVLVVDVDHNSKKLNDLLPSVATAVKIVSLGKVNLGRVAVTRHQEELKFSQLTSDARDGLLESTVYFQGQAVRLRELEGAWPGLREEADGALLGAVALGEAALGDPIPSMGGEEEEENDEEERLFIMRSLRHFSELDPDVLRIAPSQDHLVFVGVPQNILEARRRQYGWSVEEMNDRWTSLESDSPGKMEKAFDSVCSKLSPRNVHWLECFGQHDGNVNVNETALVGMREICWFLRYISEDTGGWRRTRGRGDAPGAAGAGPATPPRVRACAPSACTRGLTRRADVGRAWGRARVAGSWEGRRGQDLFFLLAAAAEAGGAHPARWTS